MNWKATEKWFLVQDSFDGSPISWRPATLEEATVFAQISQARDLTRLTVSVGAIRTNLTGLAPTVHELRVDFRQFLTKILSFLNQLTVSVKALGS